jgi:hypothetical protein
VKQSILAAVAAALTTTPICVFACDANVQLSSMDVGGGGDDYLIFDFEVTQQDSDTARHITWEYRYSYTCRNGKTYSEDLKNNHMGGNADLGIGQTRATFHDTTIAYYGCTAREDFGTLDHVTIDKVFCY